jgi:hypothetical protein
MNFDNAYFDDPNEYDSKSQDNRLAEEAESATKTHELSKLFEKEFVLLKENTSPGNTMSKANPLTEQDAKRFRFQMKQQNSVHFQLKSI